MSKFFVSLALVAFTLSTACSSQDKATPGPDAAATANKPAATAPTPAETLPEGAELIAAHVAAAGGADKIEAIESIHAVGKVDTGDQKLVGTMELWWQKGGKFYLEQEVEGVGKSRAGYDGKVIWLDDPISELRTLEGEEAQSYIQTAMFTGHDWQQHFSAANTLAKVSLDGGDVWEVELVSDNGPNITLGLDVDTKLIRYMKTTQVTPMGRLPIEAHSEDYQEFAGYKFSMRKRSSVKSLIELEETISKLEVNVPIDPTMFSFPSEREQVPANPEDQVAIEAPGGEAPAGEAPAGDAPAAG